MFVCHHYCQGTNVNANIHSEGIHTLSPVMFVLQLACALLWEECLCNYTEFVSLPGQWKDQCGMNPVEFCNENKLPKV